MRVTSIDIYAVNSSNVCSLSFRDPTSQNPYQVSGIGGLDAEEIVSSYYGASGGSDDKYYRLSLQKRDIVVKIALIKNIPQVLGLTKSNMRENIIDDFMHYLNSRLRS